MDFHDDLNFCQQDQKNVMVVVLEQKGVEIFVAYDHDYVIDFGAHDQNDCDLFLVVRD